MHDVDAVIIGGGVVGLAAARALAADGFSVALLEKHGRPGTETSTHNSGVIHAGLYYPADSLKTTLCVEGRPLLYEFCRTHRVAHAPLGKLVVARDGSELPALSRLHTRALENGVTDVELVDRAFIARREPHIRAEAAVYSPSTGVVEAEGLVKALLRSATDNGAIVLPGTTCVGADAHADGVAVRTERETIVARQVVNAAGLYADRVSRMLGAEPFTIYPNRGEYVELAPQKRGLINGLVYPLPERSGHGLGVHVVKLLDGSVWLGPTSRYQDGRDDYEGDRLPLDAFVEPARALIPELTADDLRLAGSGIRPKLHPPGESFADFLIRRDALNPRVIQAAGIESPGLTACLAIGRLIARIAADAA
ncbi:MAG: FAD-dependent oxidoreductase [Acidobacteria bacterium]|nr:FAD-dependent oxidoreductase [Acidobacteriota bacterium]